MLYLLTDPPEKKEVFASDTSIEFSAGEYSISTDTPGPEHGITIRRAINLILTGPNSQSDQVHINCHRRFRFEFVECENLIIANMIFSSCGSASNTSSGALIIANITSLTVANVTVQHSHGYGLLGMVLYGNVTISHCKFFNNSQRPYMEVTDSAPVRMGGNCLLQMQSVYYIEVTVLTVSESEFSVGIAEEVPNHKRQGFLTGVPSPSGGGGLGVYLEELLPMSDSPWLYSRIYMNITIVNCKFFNNSAEYGGNLLLYTFHLLYAYKSTSYRLIKVLPFLLLTQLSKMGQLLQPEVVSTLVHIMTSSVTLVRMYMTESQFIGNLAKKGGGISLTYLWGINGVSKMNSVILSWLLISENHAEEGMYLEQYNIIHERSTIHLAHSKIMFNCAQKGGGGIFLLSTVLSATSHDITTFDTEDIESDTRMSLISLVIKEMLAVH